MIKIKNLTKRFGTTTVLDKMNLSIERGDRVALIGPNGAGKTTLIRTILGYYLPTSGGLTVFGKDPRRDRVAILTRIGYVPQLPPPIKMNVGELVEFSAAVFPRSSVEAICQKGEQLALDIKKEWKKHFQKLSGGMKQKLLIALALAMDPHILIMDEPAANLDPEARQAFFLQLMRSMENTTILLSSHRIDEIINLINRIVEMDHGRIVQDDQMDRSGAGDKLLTCRVILADDHEATINTLREWNFTNVSGPLLFEGRFIASERFRFLTSISRFANHIQSLEMS